MPPKRFALRAGQSAAALAALLVFAGCGIYLWLRTSLPRVDGAMTLRGLSAAVTVQRDQFGIPHISAQNVDDAMFALGFVQAQDRLFQMDMLRHFGEGRLSELAGKGTVGRDRLMRTLGLQHAAERQLNAIKPEVRKILADFAAGVNACIKYHSGAKQPYYYMLPGPEPWRPLDTLVIEKLMTLYLTQNMEREILHAQLASVLSSAELHQLFPSYPRDGPVTLQKLSQLYRSLPLGRLSALLPTGFRPRRASNNWVLDGAHTATGKPILENDPHLTYTAPPIWYLAEVEAPGFLLAGGMIPGIPFMVVGHNQSIGWGVTETGGDVEDLFIEKIDPKNPSHYLIPEGSLPFRTRHETIHVKGSSDVDFIVRSTRHGPVISDVDKPTDGQIAGTQYGGSRQFIGPDFSKAAASIVPKAQYVLALQATYLEGGDLTPQALWEIDNALNWQEFKSALRDYSAPQMNFVYADTGGTIGFFAPGRIPIRKSGNGWMPHPGWTGAYDWTGYVPFDRLPQAVNPPSGRFVTANNKIVPDSYQYFITDSWAPPYRAKRISSLLDKAPVQTITSTEAIAADVVSEMARQLLPLMLDAAKPDQETADAIHKLRLWHYAMDAEAPQPLIFIAWLRALNRDLFAPKLGPHFKSYWGLRPLVIKHILQGDSFWCGQSQQAAPATCARLVNRSLHEALSALHSRYGSDESRWRWGEAHVAQFNNPVLSRIPLLGSLFTVAVPAPGGPYTINAGDVNIGDNHGPYTDHSGPGLRMVLDFSDLSRSQFLMAPGISGNPLSAHYSDLVKGWRTFRWITLGRQKAVDALILRPKTDGATDASDNGRHSGL